MMSSNFIKACLVTLIVGFIGLLAWGIGQRRHPPIVENPLSSSPLMIKGFSSMSYFEGRLITKISADEFNVRPRKFFIFKLKSVNEAILSNVRLEIHLADGPDEELNLFPFLKANASSENKRKKRLQGIGLVTRGVIQGLTLEFYKTNKLSMIINGEKGIFDLKKGELNITNAIMNDVLRNQVIKSKKVIWNTKTKTLTTPGVYTLETPTEKRIGKNLIVDLESIGDPMSPTNRERQVPETGKTLKKQGRAHGPAQTEG